MNQSQHENGQNHSKRQLILLPFIKKSPKILLLSIMMELSKEDLGFINFASFSCWDAATAWANYCGPVKTRPQHRELRAQLFTNSVWVL